MVAQLKCDLCRQAAVSTGYGSDFAPSRIIPKVFQTPAQREEFFISFMISFAPERRAK